MYVCMLTKWEQRYRRGLALPWRVLACSLPISLSLCLCGLAGLVASMGRLSATLARCVGQRVAQHMCLELGWLVPTGLHGNSMLSCEAQTSSRTTIFVLFVNMAGTPEAGTPEWWKGGKSGERASLSPWALAQVWALITLTKKFDLELGDSDIAGQYFSRHNGPLRFLIEVC
jgi:hypothetical protein